MVYYLVKSVAAPFSSEIMAQNILNYVVLTWYLSVRKGLTFQFFYWDILFLGSDTWPTLYKAGEKQVANMLWFEEGLYADLPYGYVDNLTEFYTSENNKHVQQVKFTPR